MQAQLQFFSYVEDGSTTKDVKPLFSAHYDTVNAGPKLEKASYEKICREMDVDAHKVTFMTDNVKGTLIEGIQPNDTATSSGRSSHPYPTLSSFIRPAHTRQHPLPNLSLNPKHRPSLDLVNQQRLIVRPRTCHIFKLEGLC